MFTAGPLSLAWPEVSSLDPLAALLAVGAAVALFWFKAGMIPVLAGAAVAGLVVRLVTGAMS